MWTSGQWTDVHKILVTTCTIFTCAVASRGESCCYMLPGGSSCVLLSFSRVLNAPPQEARATFKPRYARRPDAKCTAKRGAKTKSTSSQAHQRAGAQVVTEFCGPLDNGQRSTKFWLPPALFSRVRSLRVATVAVAFSQVGPGVFLLVFLAPLMHPQRMRARPSSRVRCAGAVRNTHQNAA